MKQAECQEKAPQTLRKYIRNVHIVQEVQNQRSYIEKQRNRGNRNLQLGNVMYGFKMDYVLCKIHW